MKKFLIVNYLLLLYWLILLFKVCENLRIPRAKVLKGEEFRGFIPSKREYFYGFRLHTVVDENGFFREFQVLEGRLHELEELANPPETNFIICILGDFLFGNKLS